MQSQNFNEFKFINNYKDHLTKCVLFRSIKSKCAKKTTFNLIDVFTETFNVNAIFYSDNRREFVKT